jgi:DNA-binding protein HU-beta
MLIFAILFSKEVSNKVHKQAFIRRVSDETLLSHKVIHQVLEGSLKVIQDTLKSGGDVRFPGFGVFYTRQQPAGKVKSIRSGSTIEVPARRVAAFRVGRHLKTAVARKSKKERGLTALRKRLF